MVHNILSVGLKPTQAGDSKKKKKEIQMNHSYTLSPNKTPVNMSREYIARFESRTLFSFLSYERRTLVARELTNHDINIYIYI